MNLNGVIFDLILQEPDANSDKRICSICQKNYKIGDEIAKSRCKHNFHISCLGTWLSKKDTCPVCRSKVNRDDVEDKRDESKHKLNKIIEERRYEQDKRI